MCLPIYMNGMNSNKINFFQSEFPNLTKIKPLIRLNQNSAKVELQKSNKKVKSKVIKKNTKTNTNTNTKKKKIRFSLPSKTKTKSKTKKLY